MKYPDGAEAHVGDRVRIKNGDTGVVVFSIDANEYDSEFPREKWAHLKTGIMVRTDNGALVHFIDPVPDNLIVRIEN